MQLKTIRLSNIRSYLSQQIDFPIGSLLLSGDIGSGKSTILIAIEFALFGSKSAELPASSLLRHGKNEGFVELSFEVDNIPVIIKRTLKRGKNGIKQEVGYIIIGGIKKELSPVEMKSAVFDLLGYPRDLVSKNKDLIYRYTVYTPQEEMKKILAEDKDARLDTLRKVFNIDKYKKIKENTSIFIRSIKEKKKEFEGFISDLDDKKKELESIQKEILGIDESLMRIIPNFDEAAKRVQEKKQNSLIFEDKIIELNKLKNNFSILEAELNNLLREHNNANQEISRLSSQIEEMQKELQKEEAINAKEIKSKIKELENSVKALQGQIDIIRQKISEARISRAKSEEVIKKIANIDKCPLCLQNVQHEHKDSINEREGKIILDSESILKDCSEKEKEAKSRLESLEKELNGLRKLESRIEVITIKSRSLEEKKKDKGKLESSREEVKEKKGGINNKKIDLSQKIDALKDVEEEYKKARQELDIALDEERRIYAEKTGLEKEIQSLNRISKSLGEEIAKKAKAKEKLSSFSDIQNWLENYFANLMDTMEKHVMLQVYRQFNEVFKTWFNLLIEDETISVRLDDEFTPVIEQNGYETFIENLSGGEKTAVALSYRLALNKVIYDVSDSIKTKDILMLDEPTDGFSSEQLDRIRDVLEQLDMKQIIIVSHESKIESFVDKVIRIGKEEHISRAF
ncbi:MAG: SMC family ATPase [Nanoarchaeota archaeon]